MSQSKLFYFARNYQDRHYLEDRKLVVSNTTREIFQGSNKVLAPYLDPIEFRRLELIYDARLFFLFYFFEVLIDQAVYTAKTSITLSFQELYNIPKFYGILGGAGNLAPEQLLSWFQIYNSNTLCGNLGNIGHLFYRLCEYHFLTHFPQMIKNSKRNTSNNDESLRSIYYEILKCISNHMRTSYKFHDRKVSLPYLNVNTIKIDHRLHREWVHTILTFAKNTLSTI